MHELEEQVKDAETRADQSLEDETKRHLEAYHKLERDCNLEIDLLCNRQASQPCQNFFFFPFGPQLLC